MTTQFSEIMTFSTLDLYRLQQEFSEIHDELFSDQKILLNKILLIKLQLIRLIMESKADNDDDLHHHDHGGPGHHHHHVKKEEEESVFDKLNIKPYEVDNLRELELEEIQAQMDKYFARM